MSSLDLYSTTILPSISVSSQDIVIHATLCTLHDTNVSIPCNRSSISSKIVVGIILILLIIGTAVGNFLVILAVLLVKKLRTASNFLIVSLAISDLLLSIVVLPFAAIHQVEGYWQFNKFICNMYLTSDMMLCTSSILNLCVISVDRCFLITRPFTYSNKRTASLIMAMVAFAWIAASLVSVPSIMVGNHFVENIECDYTKGVVYQIYATCVAFFIPLIVMLVVYGRIFKLARNLSGQDARQRRMHLSSVSTSNGTDNLTCPVSPSLASRYSGSSKSSTPLVRSHRSCNSTVRSQKASPRQQQSTSESKAIITLGVIMGCFTVCWLPFFTSQFVSAVAKVIDSELDFKIPPPMPEIFLWLGYFNSFLNPLIYAKFNQEFRTPFKTILMCHCWDINERLRQESYSRQFGLSRQRQLSTSPLGSSKLERRSRRSISQRTTLPQQEQTNAIQTIFPSDHVYTMSPDGLPAMHYLKDGIMEGDKYQGQGDEAILTLQQHTMCNKSVDAMGEDAKPREGFEKVSDNFESPSMARDFILSQSSSCQYNNAANDDGRESRKPYNTDLILSNITLYIDYDGTGSFDADSLSNQPDPPQNEQIHYQKQSPLTSQTTFTSAENKTIPARNINPLHPSSFSSAATSHPGSSKLQDFAF